MRTPAPLLLLLHLLALVSADSPPTSDPPCTATSPLTHSFVDLRPLTILHSGSPSGPDNTPTHLIPNPDWAARGWDYPANFTVNICGAEGEGDKDKEGEVKDPQLDVGAFYTVNGTSYSLGRVNDKPMFRGRKLVLTYTDGSPCTSSSPSDTDSAASGLAFGSPRRKSTTISFQCDNSLLVRAAVSFVGTPDECAYFFEVRTSAACPGVKREEGVGVGALFGGIAGVFAVVYFIGGCMYQRTVMHARGWRQLPNYGLWSGIGGWIYSTTNGLLRGVLRCIPCLKVPRRQTGGFGRRDARGTGYEDENRVLDALDEEWEGGY
ncbi:mannose 6-phosphate receptor domain-containing protein [Ascobolus immersus RN42]|uniref:Mannose 6-phosphate receptor domain-containing protein n=1 Tax=Ascobolus immersus RN42 TaxID=1160509 RepID=A0A3N4HX42_ASCIM|nr:mannose 6-phosphate receptor domain-containing protein [Ascobolus immersus RN42]